MVKRGRSLITPDNNEEEEYTNPNENTNLEEGTSPQDFSIDLFPVEIISNIIVHLDPEEIFKFLTSSSKLCKLYLRTDFIKKFINSKLIKLGIYTEISNIITEIMYHQLLFKNNDDWILFPPFLILQGCPPHKNISCFPDMKECVSVLYKLDGFIKYTKAIGLSKINLLYAISYELFDVIDDLMLGKCSKLSGFEGSFIKMSEKAEEIELSPEEILLINCVKYGKSSTLDYVNRKYSIERDDYYPCLMTSMLQFTIFNLKYENYKILDKNCYVTKEQASDFLQCCLRGGHINSGDTFPFVRYLIEKYKLKRLDLRDCNFITIAITRKWFELFEFSFMEFGYTKVDLLPRDRWTGEFNFGLMKDIFRKCDFSWIQLSLDVCDLSSAEMRSSVQQLMNAAASSQNMDIVEYVSNRIRIRIVSSRYYSPLRYGVMIIHSSGSENYNEEFIIKLIDKYNISEVVADELFTEEFIDMILEEKEHCTKKVIFMIDRFDGLKSNRHFLIRLMSLCSRIRSISEILSFTLLKLGNINSSEFLKIFKGCSRGGSESIMFVAKKLLKLVNIFWLEGILSVLLKLAFKNRNCGIAILILFKIYYEKCSEYAIEDEGEVIEKITSIFITSYNRLRYQWTLSKMMCEYDIKSLFKSKEYIYYLILDKIRERLPGVFDQD